MIEKVLYNIYIDQNGEVSVCNEKGSKGKLNLFTMERKIDWKDDPKDPNKRIAIPESKITFTIEFEFKDEEK